ncbi:MAG: hypothetical protein AAGK01_04225 [Pseudomonadota bacterium]
MNTLEIVFIGLGALLLLGAFAAYLKNTEKALFPALMAVCGVFLCGAQTVKANIAGIGEVEFAKSVVEATNSTTEALTANKAAIDEINTAMAASQTAFDEYRDEVNERFAELDTEPVEFEGEETVQQSTEAVQAQILRVDEANKAAVVRTQQLKKLTDRYRLFK